MISWRGFWSLAACVFFSSLIPRIALAAANDAAAAKLREAAIYQDYLATDFASAEKKLSQALALCEKPADCTAATRARLHCDLGSVYFAEQKADEANAQFAAAAKEDPNVGIDPDLTTPELQKAFAAAKGAKPAGPQGQGGEKTAPPAANAPNEEEESTDENAEPAPKAPVKAETSSDCPPGFPGCKSNASSCSNDDDCSAGEKCADNKCVSLETDTTGPGKANWISLGFQADLLLLPQAQDVCLGGQGYSCFNSNGTWYSGIPAGKQADSVQGGLSLATMRVLASYDRRLANNFTVGGAVGFAFRGGPHRPGASAFLPFHGEIRGKYWFGRHPLGRAGFRANLMLGLGVAEVDASIPNVPLTDSMGPSQKTAWRKTGTGFGTVGVGVGWAFTPNAMLMLEPRFMQMFPTSGEVIGIQLSFGYGF